MGKEWDGWGLNRTERRWRNKHKICRLHTSSRLWRWMFIAQYFLIAKSVETLFYSRLKTLLKNNQVSDIVIREKYINEKLP